MPLGPSWGRREPSGGRLRCFWSLWDLLGPCGALWEAAWSAVGADFGALLGRPRRLLSAWRPLGLSWGHLGGFLD
eukprot:8794245-Pyramimonas_sp.AAC.1